jgi:hypothetical protein
VKTGNSAYVTASSPKLRTKLWKRDSEQIVWKCLTVQIFGNESNK